MATIPPPGQERECSLPTKTGTIPFKVPNTDRECETYYFLWGDLSGGKVPFIVLHGGPGSTCALMEPYSLLNNDIGVPVILYDQIGCGKSTRLPEKKGDTSFWTAELFMDELENLISALGITTFDLSGLSWGGMLASVFAIRRQPSGLRKLALASCPAKTATRVAETNRMLVELPAPHGEIMRQALRDNDFSTEAVALAKQEFSKRYMIRSNIDPQKLADARAVSAADTTVYSTMYGSNIFNQDGPMKDWNIEGELNLITAKTAPGGVLLMNGKYDGATDLVMTPFFTNIRARVKWVRFAESGHGLILDETENVLAALKSFIQSE